MNFKQRALLFTLGLFLLFTVATSYTDLSRSAMIGAAAYYGLLTVGLALFWNKIFGKEKNKQHKAEEA